MTEEKLNSLVEEILKPIYEAYDNRLNNAIQENLLDYFDTNSFQELQEKAQSFNYYESWETITSEIIYLETDVSLKLIEILNEFRKDLKEPYPDELSITHYDMDYDEFLNGLTTRFEKILYDMDSAYMKLYLVAEYNSSVRGNVSSFIRGIFNPTGAITDLISNEDRGFLYDYQICQKKLVQVLTELYDSPMSYSRIYVKKVIRDTAKIGMNW